MLDKWEIRFSGSPRPTTVQNLEIRTALVIKKKVLSMRVLGGL